MVLVQKWPFFHTFFFKHIGQENVFYDLLGQKNACLGYQNKKFKKSKNWHFFKGINSMIFVQKWPFFQLFFFQGKIGEKDVFYDILERKNAFPGFKKQQVWKDKKMDIFLKGLTHGFGPKMAIYPTFFFRQYRPGKRLLRCSRTKKQLSRLSKQEVQKVEKLRFFQKG